MEALTLSRIMDIADRLFPLSLAEPWDNCGIQVGDPQRHIARMAFSLDPCMASVRFASEHSCNLLVTHHPLFKEPVRNIVETGLMERTLVAAIRNGVDIISLHTNLDAAPGGLNDYLAAVIGLEDVSVPQKTSCARIGTLCEPVAVSRLAALVAQALELPTVRVVAESDVQVRRVFCASGSGMGYFKEARGMSIDVMVTGDVRYHAALEAAELGVPVIDAGHFGTERFAPRIMADAFRREFKLAGMDIPCLVCESQKDPFFYIYPG